MTLEAAAGVLAEMRHASSETHTVHLVNPSRLKWEIVTRVISSRLQLRVVPFSDWLERLESFLEFAGHAGEGMTRARKILPFLRGVEYMNKRSGLAMGHPEVSIKLALNASPTLAHGGQDIQVSEEIISQWIVYWRRKGLLQSVRRASL